MKSKKKSLINTNNSTTGRLKQPEAKRTTDMELFVTSLLIAMFAHVIPEETIRKDVSHLFHLKRTRGNLYLIRYLKALEEVLNQPNRKHNFVGISIGITKDGFVKKLSRKLQLQYRKGDASAMKYLHTLIKVKDLFTANTITDFASVTGENTGEKDPVKCQRVNADFKSNAHSLAAPYRRLRQKDERPAKEENYADKTAPKLHKLNDPFPHYYVSRKSGPNGESLFTRFQDCKAIEGENLLCTLNDFTEIFTEGNVSNHFSDSIKDVSEINLTKKVHSARLHVLLEGGKTKPRVICIIDGLTQQALTPYHEALMSLLRTIPEDCTFNQDAIVNHASRWQREKRTFYGSTDLSSATDRIPKILYEIVGDSLQEGLGKSWVAIFDRNYDISKCNNVSKTINRNTTEHVSYTVGQPMGALSSWPKMAIVHHVLVWTAAGGRKNAQGKYALLGDDIVIVDETLSENYCKLLQHYGIGFTEQSSTNRFEFAKRHFTEGSEVSGIPIRALYTNLNQPIVFAMEYINLANRGYTTANPEELTSGPGEFLFSRFSKRDMKKIKTLLLVPGTDANPLATAKWLVNLSGRSGCHLRGDATVENALKPFRQVAGLILSGQAKAKFSTLLKTSGSLKDNLQEGVIKSLEAHGIIGGLDPNLTKLVEEHAENLALIMSSYIFRLERDYKKLYTDPTTEVSQLLRPRVKDWLYPLFIDRSADAKKAVIKCRGKFLLQISSFMRM